MQQRNRRVRETAYQPNQFNFHYLSPSPGSRPYQRLPSFQPGSPVEGTRKLHLTGRSLGALCSRKAKDPRHTVRERLQTRSFRRRDNGRSVSGLAEEKRTDRVVNPPEDDDEAAESSRRLVTHPRSPRRTGREVAWRTAATRKEGKESQETR